MHIERSGHKYESLEERLIQFSVDILNLVDDLPNTRAGNELITIFVQSVKTAQSRLKDK